MADEHLIQQYRNWYAKLLRLYSKPYYERFGEGMEQTFHDLLRERAKENRGLLGCASWVFAETIRENGKAMFMQNRNITRIALATAFLLLVPLVAMQFTKEVTWSLADFVVAGVLLFGTGLTFDLVTRRAGTIVYRFAVGTALITALALVWINLAVGIIGTENNPANLMYVGVLAIGMIGAFIARFQSHQMARALFATALAQTLVALIALVAKLVPTWRESAQILILNGFFVALWIGSALLFLRASTTGSKSNLWLE